VMLFRYGADAILRCHGGKALQYGQTEGLQELRAWLAAKHSVAVENVLITSGAQQALDLIGRVLLDPGDRVAVENPTYLALLLAWRPLSVEFAPVNCDDEGLFPEEIPAKSKLLYAIPNFQNPQGTTLSEARRVALASKALRERLIIVEDQAYAELRYGGDPLPSLFSLTGGPAGSVIHVGTFSKVLAPGLRVGYIIAGSALIEKLVLAKQPMDLHTSTWNQYLVHEILSSGFLSDHIASLRSAYTARRDAMLAALTDFMPPSIRWTNPLGGMFLLATLPPEIDAAVVAAAAVGEKVLIVPGADFHLRGGRNTFRLNFSNAQPETIRTGIAKLAQVVASMLASPTNKAAVCCA
jgi:2-aminoadipate transaminase